MRFVSRVFVVTAAFFGSCCTTKSSTFALATSARSDTTSSITIKYFDARGAAEGSRLLLAIAGEDYNDERFTITPGSFDSPGFKAAKEDGSLSMNMNRAPVMIVDGTTTIGQSKAMERYLANRFGLMGSNPIEAALIDCISEHCRDVKDAQMAKRFSMFVKDKTDEEKAIAQKEWFETDMPAMLAKLETSVKQCGGTNDCAVGNSVSYADVAIYLLLKECFPAYQVATLAAAEDCPTLLACCETVANHPGVKDWIEKRPKTNF